MTQLTQRSLFGDTPRDREDTGIYPASRVMLASGAEHWCTPPEVLQVVRSFAPIAFDPFSNAYSLVRAAREIARPDDSLTIDWPDDGLIFANPPYGEALFECARKIGAEGRRGREILVLVPARLDTAWWQDELAPPIYCAWRGRITFLETVEALLARHADRAEKVRAAGLKPPKQPQFQREGAHLARGETATFSSVMAYFGPRPGRFAQVFGGCGRIYHELG